MKQELKEESERQEERERKGYIHMMIQICEMHILIYVHNLEYRH